MFADVLPLLIHQYAAKKKEKISATGIMPSVITASLLFAIILTDFTLSGIKSSGQAYDKFGLLHYHISHIPCILQYDNSNTSSRSIKEVQIEEEADEAAKNTDTLGLQKAGMLL